MTGRCDIPSGSSAHVGTRSDESLFDVSAIKLLTGILEAGNPAAQVDSENAVKMRLNRNRPDRGGSFSRSGNR